MKKAFVIKNLLSNHFPILSLITVWAILFIANYTPGTYLTGWDNLQTELDPALAVKRALYSGWQEYQSFGLPAGMGHAADLMRSLALYFASFFVPQNLIRYGFHMLMVLIGALGVLKLLYLAGLSKEQKNRAGQDKRVFALLGAFFYLLNYNIIQMLYLPYESFTIFAGMLPWQIWIFLKILNKEKLKTRDFLLFFIIFLLATSSYQALQLFVVLGMALGLITIGALVSAATKKLQAENIFRIIRRASLSAVFVLLINSFWLLSQFYFLNTASSVVQTAKINELSTQDVLYRNRDKGNLKDFFSYTGFFNDGVGQNQEPLFAAWHAHRESLPVMILIFTLSGISLLGILAPSKFRASFVFLYALVVLTLLNNVPVLNTLNDFIRGNSFINQIFRSPFTKFSILYALVASYFFAFGSYFVSKNILSKIPQKSYVIKHIFSSLLILGILYHAFPAFSGNYVSSEVRVKIPDPYFEMFEYFKTVDKNQRIALLPEYTHWGWIFTSWGYDGSGFMWYGIEQPIISRNFDMWSSKSEGYYWEMKTAIEKEDVENLNAVLSKYNVSYLVFDRSIEPVVASSKAIQDSRVEELLGRSSKLKLIKQWEFITLYQVLHDKTVKNFIWTAETLPNIGPSIDLTNTDTAYIKHGDYQTDPEKSYEMYYPFLDLTTQANPAKINWELEEESAEWVFRADIPENTVIPQTSGSTDLVLYKGGNSVSFTIPYTVKSQNDKAEVRFPKILASSFAPTQTYLRYCVNKDGKISTDSQSGALTVRAADGDYVCADYEDLSLDQRYGYIIKIENENIEGQRLFFYALDKTKDQPYIEDRLSQDTEYYILGERFPQGIGYSFSFQANSYNTIPSVNKIKGLFVYLMPYDALKSLGIKTSSRQIQGAKGSADFEAEKIAYHKYEVKLDQDSAVKTIVLNQAYQPGWKAYMLKDQKSNLKDQIQRAFPSIFGEEIKDHVIVNNWANGWIINDGLTTNDQRPTTIAIVYLPQYLEYLGFSLLAITFISLLALSRFDKWRRI
jgi:hypothetical protein